MKKGQAGPPTRNGRLSCYCHLLLFIALQKRGGNTCNVSVAVAEATEDAEFPTAIISACKYSQLRFSHIDDIFGACKQEDGGDVSGGASTDSFWGGNGAAAAWEYTVSHGWEMAEAAVNGGSGVQTDSAFVIGSNEERDGDAITPGIGAAYPFLVCLKTEAASSGYDNLYDILPLVGAISSDVTVLSNGPKESCFMLSANAASAHNAAVSLPNLLVLPMTDIMKLDSGIVKDVCLNEQWAVPWSYSDARKVGDKTWERKIRVGLRPGLGGTKEKVNEVADQMIEEIRHMAKAGRRQRKLLRREGDSTRKRKESITESFSVTASTITKVFNGRRIADDEVPLHHHQFWSRVLDEGIESEDGCAEMFEALSMESRFSHTGFDLVLNPAGGQNFANNSTSSAGNSACICSLIAALSVHPDTLEVSANQPIELHNLQAQHLIQSGRPQAQTPFFDVGLTGKDQVVSVSDTGLSMTHCYFKNSNAGDTGNVFNGNWDMSARKVVHYDNTYGDTYDAFSGHGSHVAGTVAGAVISGSGAYNPGSGVAKDSKISFFDMAIGSSSVYDPGAARLFSSFYNNGKGAKVTIGSWGRNYQSRYSQECQDVDAALHIHEDVLYVASSGNGGDSGSTSWRTVKNPADCKNTLSVGASQSYGSAIKSDDLGPSYMASFSARGPTADGRIAPDVVAPGYMINSAISDPTSSTNCAFAKWAGTSMAAPVVAGAAAQIRQYFAEGWYPGGFKGSGLGFEASGSLVKAVLMNGGQLLKGVQRVPNGPVTTKTQFYDNNQNMGVINLMKSLPLFRYNQINAMVVNSDEITRGATHRYDLDVRNCPQDFNQLSATLVWYDPAPASNCQHCLVNNLDLSMKTPLGGMKHPNGLTHPDRKNNAERIRFDAAGAGKYQVIVNASNMATSSQRYSLVATGCFSFENQAVRKVTRSDFFLDSLWSGGLKSSGSMFGIVAKQDINVTSFEFHSTMKADDGFMFLDIYAINGTFIGNERSREKWSKVASNVMIAGSGRGEATRIPDGAMPKLLVKNGESKGIYITMKFREELRYTAVDQAMGEVFSENTDLQILVGSGNAYEGEGFGEVYPRRMFNGRVIYEKIPHGGNLLVKEDSSVGTLQPQAPAVKVPTRVYLETLWNGGIKNSGSMFGVVAKTTIQIESIYVNSPYSGMIEFEVYKIDGSSNGREKSPNEWNLVGTARVEGGGEGKPTIIPSSAFLETFTIHKGQTVGIYVTMKYQLQLRYSPVQLAVGDVFAENSDLAILVGTGNDYPFSNFYSKRMFNGALVYSKLQDTPSTPSASSTPLPTALVPTSAALPSGSPSTSPKPSPAPSSSPTSMPTTLPTESPSTIPTPRPTIQSLSLETLWEGGVKNSGNMFDIVAKADLRITSFLVNTPSSDNIDFEVYSIKGGHRGNEQIADRWTLVANGRVVGAGEGYPTIIRAQHFKQDIIILAQETLGLYITMTDKREMRYTPVRNKSAGDVYASNLDLAILVGTGNGYPFGQFWQQRVFNGSIEYQRLSEGKVSSDPVLQGVPFTSISWNTESSGVDDSVHGWSVLKHGFLARFEVENSYTCDGTNSMTQVGEATSVVSVGSPTPLYFELRGMGEQFEAGYEMLTFEIDGNVIASATSVARGIECSAGPVSVTKEVPSPYYLSPGKHHLRLKFTTRDGYDHSGVYYEIGLGFEPLP